MKDARSCARNSETTCNFQNRRPKIPHQSPSKPAPTSPAQSLEQSKPKSFWWQFSLSNTFLVSDELFQRTFAFPRTRNWAKLRVLVNKVAPPLESSLWSSPVQLPDFVVRLTLTKTKKNSYSYLLIELAPNRVLKARPMTNSIDRTLQARVPHSIRFC